jgi:hypothetical protein
MQGDDEVIAKNVGRVDRTLRLVAGVAIALVGLLALGGGRVEVGIAALAVALLLLLTSLTRVCPGYVPFGISTIGEEQKG